MEITKFKHACLVLTKNNQSLVIDPGEWSDDFTVPQNTVGIIVTHEHGDHFSFKKLREIIHDNPKSNIYAHVDIIAQLDDISGHGISVTAGETVDIGDFKVKFTGGVHATIHASYPVCANLGAVVDEGALYYPGDSFVLPDMPIETLAVPAAAPWLKISEAMDFINKVRPKTCFPTHNAILSEEGHSVFNAWLEKACSVTKTEFKSLDQ